MTTAAQFSNTLSASDGGPARHALEVNLALNALDERVRLIAFHTSGDSLLPQYGARADFPRVAPPVELSLRPGRQWRRTVTALREAIRARVWIVHGYYLWWIPLTVFVGIVCRKRVLIMPHGALTKYDRERSRRKKGVFDTIAGWWISRAALFVVATREEAGDLAQLVHPARIFVVGAGASSPDSIAQPRVVHSPVRLLSIFRIAVKKRIDRSIHVLAALRARGIDAELSIAGEGPAPLVNELRELAKELGVARHVSFLGQVEGMAKEALFAGHDIFLLLSEDENFGIGVAEALVRGLPAVVTPAVASASGMPASAGRRVDGGDVSPVADAVADLVSAYESSSVSASAFGRDEYSWRSVAHRWVSVMESER